MAEQASVLQSFPFKAAVFALFVVLLPLFPSKAPAGLAGQAFLSKAWELLHLLFVGVAVSYGLFGRKNAEGRVAAEKEDAPAKPDARYVSQMLQESLVFDDDDELSDSPCGLSEDGKVQSWSALHHPNEPVVMVATKGRGRSHTADTTPMSLLVRSVNPQPAEDSNPDRNGERRRRSFSGAKDSDAEIVLRSPIPWPSRPGRIDASRPASPSPSPKRLSPASSLSKETLTKASEDYVKKRSPYNYKSSPSPPAPPPPPPPFLVHGYHPVAERRTAAKSFKEELKDHSMRDKEQEHMPNSYSFNSTCNKPRSFVDGSSSSAAIKSVRTVRKREVMQSQSQELPDQEAALHGSEELNGYRAYQTIPKFQYEKGSDGILDKVTVSSDDSESSDDDDDDDDIGEYSARTSPASSTPEVDENEVDRKAAEFISKFREQIRRQRIESIKKSAGPQGLKHAK